MIELSCQATPEALGVVLALEEAGLAYHLHRRESPGLLLDDSHGPGGQRVRIGEAGAMLIYLTDKADGLMPGEVAPRVAALEWLMVQVGRLTPILTEAVLASRNGPPDRRDRAVKAAAELYVTLNNHLADHRYLAGDACCLADLACFAWVADWSSQGIHILDFPDVKRWLDAVAVRPAVDRALTALCGDG